MRFKVDNGYSGAFFAIETGGGSSYRRFEAEVYENKLIVYFMPDDSHVNLIGDLLTSVSLNTWYVLQIVLDDSSGFTIQVFKESDPTQRGSIRYPMQAGLSWRFYHAIYNANNAYIDDYREFTGNRYYYDQGTNGIGRRTAMSDLSGNSTWTYDSRGRVTQEQKVVNSTNGGNFKTEWGYISSDAVAWMKYPTGNGGQDSEQVNFAYNRQMGLISLSGSSTYVNNIT